MFKSGTSDYFLEIAYNAKSLIETLLRKENIEKYRFIKDYNNHYRILIMEK
jgi:hypothetical protein